MENLSKHFSTRVTFVTKRNGEKQQVFFDKIVRRIQILAEMNPKLNVDTIVVAQKVIQGIYNGVSTKDLDVLAGQTAFDMSILEPEYGILASRIVVSNMHKETEWDYSKVCKMMYEHYHHVDGRHYPLITKDFYEFVTNYKDIIQSFLDYNRDYNYGYFSYKQLEYSYLTKIKDKLVERPQQMLMRVAIGIHYKKLPQMTTNYIKTVLFHIENTYNMLSLQYYTHATPTLLNSGKYKNQLASWFLLEIKDDSLIGIYDTLKDCAIIAQNSGGIGIHIHKIRANNSIIYGTNGKSNGIIPMLRVFNESSAYVDQGGGKRKGSIAVYLEPWHLDIENFLDLKKNTGKEKNRCRDLFYGLWVPDLFMKRVENDSKWSLFCPSECGDLSDLYGHEFEKVYINYEKNGKARKSIDARVLWKQIIDSQIETGTPYMLYKDACNIKSNQKNLGTIKSSNLCTEIIQYTSPDEIAMCNLASISLKKCVLKNNEKPFFCFDTLYQVVYDVTIALNKVIDNTYYPLKEAEYSNLKHRPLGIGVQALAETFFMLRFPFDSIEAKLLNKNIFETMYFAAMQASCDLAQKEGAYSSYKGSPVSNNIFSFDMWNVKPTMHWDWDTLRERVKKYGVRNSLLLAPMPTATTSTILGNNECFEPIHSNIYVKRTFGEYIVTNTYLVEDLIQLGLWNNEMKDLIISHDGSIQEIASIPKEIKELYKTVWDIKMKDIIDMAADRAPYIDQSQSMNLYVKNPTYASISSMHFYGWKKGLKTGLYYLRSKAATGAIKFTVDIEKLEKLENNNKKCSPDSEACTLCSS